MRTTTEFAAWLDAGNAPEGLEEIYNLYMAAQGEGEGIYQTTVDPNGTIKIIGPGGEPALVLVSDAARAAFLRQVQAMNPQPDMDLHGALMYDRGMRKND